MVKKIFAQTYLWVLLLLLYSPIVIIVIYSFTEAKVLGNWTGFSTKLYSSLFNTGAHHSLMNALINTITIALLAATASTLLGSIAAIGIFNLKARSRKAIGFVNSIPILNGDIITGISLFLLFVSLGITQGYTTVVLAHITFCTPYVVLSVYNPQLQISAESETKRSIFREKDKTKRSKKESAQHSKSRNKSFVMTSVSAL